MVIFIGKMLPRSIFSVIENRVIKLKYMMTAEEVAKELGVSKGYAYKRIKKMNKELVKDGFIVIYGKVPRAKATCNL